jgi:hypothetical protein
MLNNKPYSGLQELIAGFRLLISEAVTGGYTGYRYIGNVLNPAIDCKQDFAEVYNTATGQEMLWRKIPIKQAMSFKFGVNDLFAKNYARWFNAGPEAQVAGDAAATAGPDLIVAGLTGDEHGLSQGRQSDAQRGAIKVYNLTDTTLLVENTDYKVKKVYGWTIIEMLVDTHAGDVLRIGKTNDASAVYEYNKIAHIKVAPNTKAIRNCKIRLQAPSKSGGAWEFVSDLAQLSNDGTFDTSQKDASSMKFALDFLDNSAADSSYPFGYIMHYGENATGMEQI